MKRTHTTLMVFGLAFFWPIFRRDSIGLIFGNNIGALHESRQAYLLFLVFVIAAAIAILWKWKLVDSLLVEKPWLVPLLSMLASVGCLGLIAANQFEVLKIFLVPFGSLFYAVWFASIVIAWGKLMSRTSGFDCFYPIVISFIMSYAFSSLCLLSDWLLYFMPLVGPAASGLFWFACFKSSEESYSDQGLAVSFSAIPVKRIALLTIFLLAGGLVRGFLNRGVIASNPSFDLLETHAISIVIVGIIILLTLTQRTPSALYRRTWMFLAILLFAGLFVLAIISDQNMDSLIRGRSLIIACRTCFGLLLWLVLSLVSAQKTFPSVVLFCLFYTIGEAVASLSSYLLVPAFVQFLEVSFTSHLMVFSLAMAFMLLVASFAFLNSGLFQDKRNSEGEDNTHARVCSELADEYGLSEREAEILDLISLGHSQKKIASMLYLSPNTVQSYAKSVYKKMGVHKRQEIIDLVAGGRGG